MDHTALAQRSLVAAPTYNIPEFSEYVRTEWKLLCKLRLEVPERSISDLAASLGFNAGTVRAWLRNPAYQRYENWAIEIFKAELLARPTLPSTRFSAASVPERFQEYEHSMQEHLLDIIETSANDKLRSELAQYWLEMSGHVAPKKIAAASGSLNISDSRLVIFIERAKEAGLGFDLPAIGATLEASDK